jgi:hypothetical protein
MGRTRTSLLCALAALSLPLAAAPLAHADAFDRIFRDYQKTGKVNPCLFTEAELQQAQGEVPNDIQAYAPDFPNALQTALEQRTGGACKTAAGQPAAGTTAAGATPAATTPAAPPPQGATVTPAPTPDPTAAPAASDQAIAKTALGLRTSDAGTPAPVVALGVLGALLALGGLGYGLAHWLAWDPRWARHARHAVGEAGWRAGNTWSEFTDWVRFGR